LPPYSFIRHNMFLEIQSLLQLKEFINSSQALLAYFSHAQCNVCKVLKPKIETLVREQFPNVHLVYIDTQSVQEAAGQFQVFTAPTLLIFFDGKEFFRKSRNIGIAELEETISRPYRLFFED
jgi:thioredoxin 1